MTNKIDTQTQALSDQLKKCNEAKTDEEAIKELEKYQQMVKDADFSPEAQAASKKKKVSKVEKMAARGIVKIKKGIDKFNYGVPVPYKEKRLAEEAERKKCQKKTQ